MAYNKDFPADDSYLADFPANEREQIRAIVEDKIVNAGKVNGLTTSNGSGQVPVSNGTVNTNLNADLLDGHHAEYFSPSGHRHNNASTSSDGFMSAADKTKLDGVSTGAEVNQNAFGNVAVGTSTLQAGNKQDTLYIAAGSNVSIAADETNDKITIGLTGIVPVANGGTGKSDLDNVNVGGAGTLNSWKYRPTTANNTFADTRVRYYLATSNMTTAKPPSDGAILHLPWDNGLFDMQLHISDSDAAVSVRAQKGSADWSGSTGWKALAFEADVPKNNGTGATGTWPISVDGNADTATKATGDSDGNNIKDTYAKKAETYNKTEVNTIKDNIISNPLVGNDVLWDYLHRLGRNPTLPTTNAALNALGVFMSYFDQANKIANQPGQYGQLINLSADKGDESAQLWIEQPNGRMFHRGGNASTAINDTPFKRFLDTDDLSAAGVVAGNVSNANAWWVKLGGTIPLIIQGGKTSTNTAGSQLERQAFPIQFTSQVMSVVVTYLHMNQEGGAMVASTSNSDFHFSERCYANRSNDSPLFYIALGV